MKRDLLLEALGSVPVLLCNLRLPHSAETYLYCEVRGAGNNKGGVITTEKCTGLNKALFPTQSSGYFVVLQVGRPLFSHAFHPWVHSAPTHPPVVPSLQSRLCAFPPLPPWPLQLSSDCLGMGEQGKLI